MSKKYYPEIDGLRAVAVICVLLFHLNPKGLMPGGYLGVDVFFVISGYLITGIIFTDMQQGTFHYFQFLGRRIARLYPALLFTIFLILVAGFFIYDISNYIYTAKIVRYALFSISNLKFMQQLGYWDISSTNNPVLHTWSLGVEQQFYILFPIIIYFVLNRFKTVSSVVKALLILSSISFICSQLLSQSKPSANFYFTVSRLFELGIGGLFALIGGRYKKISNSKKEVLFSLGVITIVMCAIFYINGIKYHPGVTTIPVVIASLLCIIYNDAKYAGYILRNNISVYLGKISYSIYLIHWPLIVFYQFLIQKSTLTPSAQVTLFVVTLVISSVMYHFVENKYRRISISFFSKTGKVFVSLFVLIFALNYTVYAFKGLPWRLIPYPKEVQELSLNARKIKEYSDWTTPRILGAENQSPIAIFAGDSYLGQYIEQIDLYFKRKNQSIYFIAAPACTISTLHVSTSDICLRNTKIFYDSLDKHLPIVRIYNLAYLVDYATKGKLYDSSLNHISTTFEDLFNELVAPQQSDNSHTLFVLSQPVMERYTDPTGKAYLFDIFKPNLPTLINYHSDILRVTSNNAVINFTNSKPNASYIETYDLFCDSSHCYNADLTSGIFYYSDTHHLSRYGAKVIWDNIGDQVYEFILKNNSMVKE